VLAQNSQIISRSVNRRDNATDNVHPTGNAATTTSITSPHAHSIRFPVAALIAIPRPQNTHPTTHASAVTLTPPHPHAIHPTKVTPFLRGELP
jgi:hypothetical protein